MSPLTLPQKTLLHLYRYRHISPGIGYGAPREMTQDGIAEALGISRSHASIIANNLTEKGMLTTQKIRILGASCPRKIYFITPEGKIECERILSVLNIDSEDSILPGNINYCNSAAFWSLPEDEKTLLGCLMVLRIPVHRAELGDPPNRLVPFDAKGAVHIKQETSRWYIQKADVETLRRWHSAAADWCLDRRCDPREKLYHLYRANRKREALKLAKSWRFMFMDFPDRESRDILGTLSSEFDDDGMKLTTARMSLRMGEVSEARKEVELVSDADSPSADAMISEILLAEGRCAMALDRALDCYIGDIDTSAALGLCMNANERYSEALTYLDRCRTEMRRTRCVFRIDEILRARSDALRALGNTADADKAWTMAECWKKDPALRYRSEGPVGSEMIDVGDVQVPDVLDVPFEHREPFEPESPCEHGNLHAERGDDLGPEYACPSELHPLPVEEYLQLQGRLRVREVRWPYAYLIESHPGVELADHGDEHVEVPVLVDHYAFDLGELGQMGGIDRLLPEDA